MATAVKDDTASAGADPTAQGKEDATKATKCGPGQTMNTETGKCEAMKEAEALEAFNENLSTRMAEKSAAHFATVIQPLVDGQTELVKAVTLLNTNFAQMMAQKTAEGTQAAPPAAESKKEPENGNGAAAPAATEVAKGATAAAPAGDAALAAVAGTLNSLAQGLIEVQKTVGALQAQNAALAKTTPAAPVREERVDASKGVGGGDPNTVFDSLWPFLHSNG